MHRSRTSPERRSDEWLTASNPSAVRQSESACSSRAALSGETGPGARARPAAGCPGLILPGAWHALRISAGESKELSMPPLPKPPMDLSRSHAQSIGLEQQVSSNVSAPPDSLRQLAEWRAQALARRSFGPPQPAPRKKR
jgi:hypothetical protein